MSLKRILLVLALLGSAAAGVWFYQRPAQQEGVSQGGGPRPGGRRGANRDEVVPVLAAAVTVRDVPVIRDGIGNVQAFAAITVKPQVDGRLLSVEFREGQDVKKGDVLARIDPAIYQAQFDQALAKKAQDEANLANARLDLDRYQKLASTNAGSKQQADSQKAQVAQLEAQLRADQAAIDNAKVYLDYTTVRAPIDGRTGLRLIDAGSIVRASDASGLVSIAQVKPIAAVFTLPQRDFRLVSEAMARGPVNVAALDSDGRSALAKGRLEVVDNQMDSTTGTFKLKAVFPNEDQKLWPGQFVSVRVEVQLLSRVVTIPTPALRRGPDGPFVYLVGEGPKATVRKVRPMQQDEEIAVIGEGLKPGDQVITTGFARLTEGKAISVTLAEASAPATAPSAASPANAQPQDAARPEGQRGQRGGGQRGEGRQRRDGGGSGGNDGAPRNGPGPGGRGGGGGMGPSP